MSLDKLGSLVEPGGSEFSLRAAKLGDEERPRESEEGHGDGGTREDDDGSLVHLVRAKGEVERPGDDECCRGYGDPCAADCRGTAADLRLGLRHEPNRDRSGGRSVSVASRV